MPYCQECGSYLEQDINICSSCGNKLIDVLLDNTSLSKGETEVNSLNPDSNATPPSGIIEKSQEKAEATEQEPIASGPESNLAFNGSQSEFIPQEGISIGSHWNQVESHLGKGLIKPVAMENCMDGYHFKYDEPPRQITKPEPQKEKVVEFRFSGEPEPSEETKVIPGTDEADKVNREFSDTLGENFNQDEPQAETGPIIEPEPGTESNLEKPDLIEENPDQLTPVEEVGLTDGDLVPEIGDLEPEIRSAEEPEILWEGHRSWYGLPLKEVYRITDQSVMLLRDGQILKEIQWRTVSEIALKQNWLAKLLNIGNLEVIGIISEPLLVLEGIDHPEQLQKTLVEMLSPKV